MVWGSTTLIVLFIAVGGFVFVRQWQELQQLKQEAAQDDKLLQDQDSNKPKIKTPEVVEVSDAQDLPAAPQGYRWVQHGDHFDLVPISAPEETPIGDVQQTPQKVTEAELKRLLEEEAKWEALFAAEKAENAKIHARKVADYNHAKKVHEINLKAFELIRKQEELLRSMESGKNLSPEELNQIYKDSEQIRQLIDRYKQSREE